MVITMKRWGVMILLVVVVSLAAQAAGQGTTLLSLLQTEVNASTQLNAQSAFLRQSGDVAGATLVASFLPDHQLQANMILADARILNITLPNVLAPSLPPYLGPLGAMFSADLQQETGAGNSYRTLLKSTDLFSQQVAQTGISSTARHLSALALATSSLSDTPNTVVQGLTAALIIERGYVADLQSLAGQLQALGDATTAQTLLNAMPAHQQFATQLASALTQAGGNPATATALPVAPFTTPAAIGQHIQSALTQLAATYAIAARGTGTLHDVGAQGLLLTQ